jgi:hypothetical protein
MNRIATSRAFSTAAKVKSKPRNVVLVDGCRIPFTLAGTHYKDYMAVDLGRFALKGIINKTAIDPKLVRDIDMICVLCCAVHVCCACACACLDYSCAD